MLAGPSALKGPVIARKSEPASQICKSEPAASTARKADQEVVARVQDGVSPPAPNTFVWKFLVLLAMPNRLQSQRT